MADNKALKDLLSEWNLLVMYEHFQAENIGLEELKLMKAHHITELLSGYKLGIKIRFEHYYGVWRNTVMDEKQKEVITVEADKTTIEGKANNTLLTPVKRVAKTSLASVASSHKNNRNERIQCCPSVFKIIEESGHRGEQLMEHIKSEQPLTDAHRGLLISLIVNYFEANRLHLSLPISYEIEEQILQLFANEKLEYYRTEKRGKIYVKFGNMRRYKRQRSSQKSRRVNAKTAVLQVATEEISTDAVVKYEKNDDEV